MLLRSDLYMQVQCRLTSSINEI